MLEIDSEEEQQLEIDEVRKTIDHVVYYNSIKVIHIDQSFDMSFRDNEFAINHKKYLDEWKKRKIYKMFLTFLNRSFMNIFKL